MNINVSDPQNLIENSIKELTKKIESNPDDAVALFERGKLFWRLGRRSAAMTDYNAAIAIDPNSPAATALEQAQAIDDFYNHDLYNP